MLPSCYIKSIFLQDVLFLILKEGTILLSQGLYTLALIFLVFRFQILQIYRLKVFKFHWIFHNTNKYDNYIFYWLEISIVIYPYWQGIKVKGLALMVKLSTKYVYSTIVLTKAVFDYYIDTENLLKLSKLSIAQYFRYSE